MSKHETPLTRAYWETIGGTLYEEFRAVDPIRGLRSIRLLDGVIVVDGPRRIAPPGGRTFLDGREVVVVQTKAARLNVFLMGQALLSPELIQRRWSPASLRSVILCTADDPVLRPLLEPFTGLGLEIVPPFGGGGMSLGRIPAAAEQVWSRVGGGLLAPAWLAPTLKVEGLIVLGRPSSQLDGDAADILRGEDVCLVHSYKQSLGMYLAGEAIFASARALQLGARTVQSILICRRGDDVVEAALRRYLPAVEIEVVTSDPS